MSIPTYFVMMNFDEINTVHDGDIRSTLLEALTQQRLKQIYLFTSCTPAKISQELEKPGIPPLLQYIQSSRTRVCCIRAPYSS